MHLAIVFWGSLTYVPLLSSFLRFTMNFGLVEMLTLSVKVFTWRQDNAEAPISSLIELISSWLCLFLSWNLKTSENKWSKWCVAVLSAILNSRCVSDAFSKFLYIWRHIKKIKIHLLNGNERVKTRLIDGDWKHGMSSFLILVCTNLHY